MPYGAPRFRSNLSVCFKRFYSQPDELFLTLVLVGEVQFQCRDTRAQFGFACSWGGLAVGIFYFFALHCLMGSLYLLLELP